MLRLIVIYFVLFCSLGVFSQTKTYEFFHIATNDGLSQSSVIAINQDDFGQIWIGTSDGLNRYNGADFKIYKPEKDNNSSLSNNDVLAIEKDSDGFMWIGTSIGLNKYDPKKDTFKTYFGNKERGPRMNVAVWEIKEMSNKEIWMGTPAGLWVYNKSTDSFKRYFKGCRVTSIFESKDGSVFVGTHEGVKRITKHEGNTFEFNTIEETKDYIIQDIIEDVHEYGNLLIGSRKNSVLEYDISEGVLNSYFDEKELIDKNRNARQLLFDDENQLWIGTYDGIQIANKNREIKVLRSNINDSESLSDNFIKALFKDKKGTIWVGTYHGGINVWDESNVNFINITQKPGNIGLGFKVVSSIVHYKDFIFFGTEGGGISVLNNRTKDIEYINLENTPELKNNNIKSLYLSEDNNLWIGLFNNGLVVYNLNTKRIIKKPIPDNLLSYIKEVGVYDIQKDSHGNMLFGTFGNGLIKYNLADKSFTIIERKTKPNGLLHNIVKAIKVDSKNNIWVGTLKGLSVINDAGVIKNYLGKDGVKTGYEITSIFEDSKGNVWVGTKTNGLFKFVNNNFVFVDLSIDNAIITGISSIIEGPDSNFWISSVNQGIINYNPSKGSILAHYTLKEGLASNQFNNTSLCLKKSQIFFGGPAGATYFDASNLVKNAYVPQVILTDLKIRNKSVSVNEGNKVLSNTLMFTEDINLSYEQGNFSISFSIPNFINSSSNRYKYRLKGLDEDWVETRKNTASYTIQNPGDYTFEVKGVNSDGVSNNIATTLKITVNPAPWRTWWAFLLYGLSIFAALYYLLFVLKSKSKLKHQLDLEQMEAEQIKKTNKAKLEFFTNVSHEFRTPLTLILGPLHQILENYRGSSTMYKKLKVVESSANYLLQLINRLMDFRKLENNLIKLESAEGNIVKFLREIYLSFSEYAKNGNYDYSFNTPSDEILVYYDRHKLERVFYNLISNAFRYTPKNGKIVLRILKEEDKIRIQVEDSGVGVAKEFQDKIFERFFELSSNNKPDTDYNKGTGIGLSIVKNIVDLHNGKIHVRDNEEGKGSVFSVELLLGRAHLSNDQIIKDFKFSEDLSQYVNQLENIPGVLETVVVDDNLLKEKQTVLLVEDNKQLRKFMYDLLVDKYNILEAENGKVAYKKAQHEQVDVIISDVVMPVMTGTELCALIKQDIRTSHIPVILLTSRSALIYKLDGLESGADDYISKPFNVSEFQLRVRNILESVSRLKQKMNSIDVMPPESVVLSSLDEVLYRKALDVVDENIGNEQFDVLTFCDQLGVSRTVLFKKIKAWTDFTPNEFVQYIRLQRAAQFLEQGKMNISQISYEVGFKNPKYFSKCFREKFGKTPRDYAKMFTDN